jgi:hypothetical protein
MIVASCTGKRTSNGKILAQAKVVSAERLARWHRTARRIFPVLALVPIALLVMGVLSQLWAGPQQTRIVVGLGATTCQQFNDEVKSNPVVRRDYLAWAQGFMSGILLGRPAGVDEGLDLNPATFSLVDQLHFLEDHCAQHTSADFADAVEALYKRLRKEGKT